MTLTGSLFSGSGILDLAVHQVLGTDPAWFVENNPAASKVLAHHWPDVPNHGDIAAVDWVTVEPVDVLTGGWPCQPFSSAGKRKGATDERALWPKVARAIRVLRPGLVYLENVSAIIGAGELARAVTDLANSGYLGSWVCLRASDVGAPHRRQRIFILAWRTATSNTNGGNSNGWASSGFQGETGPAIGSAAHSGEPTSDADCERLEGCRTTGPQAGGGRRLEHPDRAVAADAASAGWGQSDYVGDDSGSAAQPAGEAEPRRCDSPDADTTGNRWREGRPEPARLIRGSNAAQCGYELARWGVYGPAIQRWERVLGRPAPLPTQIGKRGGRQLSPHFCEWIMGWPEGWVTDVAGLSRNDQLKICGNGVVPQQAVAALEWLLTIREKAAA